VLKIRTPGFVLLGITERNVRMLRHGQPIAFDGIEVGIQGLKFSIIWAADGAALCATFRSFGIEIPSVIEAAQAEADPPEDHWTTGCACPECGALRRWTKID